MTNKGYNQKNDKNNSASAFQLVIAMVKRRLLAEHEADILLHKAAKQAFDDLGIKKLPTVKSLQAEYATLLEGKKKDYAEYRRSRDEMRELLAAKANVDRLMGYGEERQNDREKEQGQNLCQCLQNQKGRIHLPFFNLGNLLDRYMAQIRKFLLCQAFSFSGFPHFLP